MILLLKSDAFWSWYSYPRQIPFSPNSLNERSHFGSSKESLQITRVKLFCSKICLTFFYIYIPYYIYVWVSHSPQNNHFSPIRSYYLFLRNLKFIYPIFWSSDPVLFWIQHHFLHKGSDSLINLTNSSKF